jgi:hypothetical protein
LPQILASQSAAEDSSPNIPLPPDITWQIEAHFL